MIMNYPTDKNLSDCIIIHTEFILDNRLSLEARTFLLQVLSIPGIEAQPIPVISEMLCIGGCKTQRILNELREQLCSLAHALRHLQDKKQ